MAEWTIYYNHKCASCRKTLDILNQAGLRPRVIEYLKNPPTVRDLDALASRLGMAPESLVRTNEPLYEELGLAQKQFSRQQWLETLAKHPSLLQRPIVFKDNQGLIARPAERVRTLL